MALLNRWLVALSVAVIGLWMTASGAVFANEPAADEKPEAEFKPPPGYRTLKRGDIVVYCRKEPIEGSRFVKDRCYDEAQLREMESLMEAQRREIDQRRRICPQPTACS